MKLIEKKCPNCGANLEFSETDRSCKCNYCHRAFEIERDQNVSETVDLSQQFILNEAKKGLNIFHFFFIPFFIVTFAIVGFIFFGVFQSFKENNTNSFFGKNVSYYTDVSELSNSDYEDIDHDAAMKIENGEGTDFYAIDGDKKREKVYVAYKENSNFIIVVYKVNYYKFPDKAQRHTVYVPLMYENIDKNVFVNKFANPQIKASEYYFNQENNSYTYGYSNIDEAYNSVIKPLADDGYNITEK